MSTLYYETFVPKGGTITLPPEFDDTEIVVRKKEPTPKKKYTTREFIDSCSGDLSGYTREEIDESRYQSMMEKLLDRLPDDVTLEELQTRFAVRVNIENVEGENEQYQKYVRNAVEESIRQLDAGLSISHEDAKEYLKKWLE